MNDNSMRKIVEGQLIRLEGNAFQDCMDRLGLELYPGDYQPIRAAGPKGDTKNDGYCPKARVFFAAHATRGERFDRTKSKIRSDLEGCLKAHRDVKTWRYLTNDTMPGEIDQFIDNDLRCSFPDVTIEVWGLKTLAAEICKLDQKKIDRIIDLDPTRPKPRRIVPDPARLPLPARLIETGRDLWPMLAAAEMRWTSDGPKVLTEEEQYLIAETMQEITDWAEISAEVEVSNVQVVDAMKNITSLLAGLTAKGLCLYATTRGMIEEGGPTPGETHTMVMLFPARAKGEQPPSAT
ncbi:hypothetical protein ACH4TC_18615 [Streptomyces spororaveus]|uniref:hypothetical protein n=1 Tax=Streptomyces spororaveus TaxID=284039 RepID=UPI00378CD7AB